MAAHLELKSIGWAIRRLRKAHNRTLEGIAEVIGWDAGNLSRVERGLQDIPESRLKQIAAALDVSMSQLYAVAESGDEDAARLLAAAQTLTEADRDQLVEFADFLVARQAQN